MGNDNNNRKEKKPVEVIQVIRTVIQTRGNGTDNHPHRFIEQFWSLDGELLAENDPFKASLDK